MPDLNEILNVLSVALLALIGYVIYLFRTATKKAVEKSAEEGAKAAIKQLQWPAELARDLQKARGVERQELRYKSYGELWKELRPLAIYDVAKIDRKTVGQLFSRLSDWYFSEWGGLLLTPQAGEFALPFRIFFGLRPGFRRTGMWTDLKGLTVAKNLSSAKC